MAEEKAEKKETIKKKRGTKINTLYDTSSGLKRKNKSCPKCGQGVFMAQHKDRSVCGKCGYTEFSTKSEEKSVTHKSKSESDPSKEKFQKTETKDKSKK